MRCTTALPLLVVAAALTAVTTGCILPDDFAAVQNDVNDMRQQIARMTAEQQATQAKLDELRTQLESADTVKRSDFADTRAELDRVSRQVGQLDERIRETQGRIDRMGQDVAATRDATRRLSTPPPTDAPPGTPRPPTDAVPDANALYNQAYADFSKGNFPLAISGFEEFVERFPDTEMADNALYWIGECYFSQGRYAPAVETFDRLLDKYPKSDKAAAADLKKGLAWIEANQVQKAIVQLRHVVDTYPSTDEARVAADRLESLGATRGRI